eukprot:gene21413-8686_t
MSSLLDSADAVLGWARARHPRRPLLVVGQRTNADVPIQRCFRQGGVSDTFAIGWGVGHDGWERDVERMERDGAVFQPDAEDYFLVSRGLWQFGDDVPDFVVGGRAFDNWLVARAVREGRALTVDASRTVGRTSDCRYATVRTARGVEVLRREQLFLD